MVSLPLHPIKGVWLPFKAELDGDAAPEMALANMRLVIDAGTYAVHFGHEVTDSGHYILSVMAEAHILTLTGKRGPNKNRTIPSIYQLVGDRLRICFGLDGTLPASFAAPSGSRRYLVSYRRVTS